MMGPLLMSVLVLLDPIGFGAPLDALNTEDHLAQVEVEGLVTPDVPVTGSLEGTDDALESTNEYFDVWVYSAVQGETLVLNLASEAFDTYLLVRSDGGLDLDNDDIDYEGGNTDSSITFTVLGTERLYIYVTSFQAGELGPYTLSLSTDRAMQASAADQTLAVGGSVTGALDGSDPVRDTGEIVDTYTLTLGAPQEIEVRLISEDFDTVLTILGPADYRVTNDDAPGLGTNSLVSETLPYAGEYQVMVTSYAPAETGGYHLSARSHDRQSAVPGSGSFSLAMGAPVSGALETGDETLSTGEFLDPYTFWGTADQRVELAMNSEAFDTYLILRGPAGLNIDNDDIDATNRNSRLVAALPADGIYQVYATSFQAGEVGAYLLLLSTIEGEASPAIAIRPGETLEGTLGENERIRPGGQYYRSYRFEGRTGQQFSVDLSSAEFDTYVILRSPDGLEQDNDDIDFEAGNTDSHLEWTLPSDGAYEILVSSYWTGQTGTYVLGLSIKEMPIIGPIDFDSDVAEPVASAITFGVQEGALEATDALLANGAFVDRFPVVSSGDEHLTVRLDADGFDTMLSVTGPGGFIDENDDSNNTLNSMLELELAMPGTYVVSVTSYSPGVVGAYRLTFEQGTSLSRALNGRIFGVFAGITDYQSGDDLPLCADDAIKLHETLSRTGLLAPESVVLTNGQVTEASLRGAFARVAAAAGPDDVFIFFFSGHGNQVVGVAPDEPDEVNESIVLVDGSDLTDDAVAVMFEQIETNIAMIALDTCFSGGFARDIVTRPNRIGIFSSEEDVTSNVARRFQAGGYLSYFLREGLGGAAEGAHPDGFVTVGELTRFLRRQWAEHVLDVGAETFDTEPTFQNLVIERGGVGVTEILIHPLQ